MRSPFASEASAFRFLLLTVAAFAAVAAAAILGGARAAVPVWAVLSAAAIGLYGHRSRRGRPLRTAPAHLGPPQERRLLLLAQEPPPDQLLAEIRDRADRVLVVGAPVAPPLRRWASDLDGAREQARQEVEATVARLRSLNANAAGTVGDDDPLQAVEDALRTFGADEIVISTPAGPSGEAMAARIRERYALPATHLVS